MSAAELSVPHGAAGRAVSEIKVVRRRPVSFTVLSLGEPACIEDTPNVPRPTTEARLINALRIWRENPNAMLKDGITVDREICGLLEWYICGCIPYGPNELGGWWSDGVIHLEITESNDHSFKLLGVTWIGCQGVAPFEIDVEVDPDDDDYFAKTIFRIGMTDEHGVPKVSERTRNVQFVLENRPRFNRDWAMAVELTPPENTDRTKR